MRLSLSLSLSLCPALSLALPFFLSLLSRIVFSYSFDACFRDVGLQEAILMRELQRLKRDEEVTGNMSTHEYSEYSEYP